jgi:hypothetical protein
MSDDRSLDMRRQLIDEIWEEIASLKGKELDEYLAGIGLSPEDLLRDYSRAMDTAIAGPKRARFEEARSLVRQRKVADFGKILSFDLAKKKEIMAAIRDRADRTNEMTIAARNRKIEDENDLDVFLEACLRLGLIDSAGNLKD